MHLVLMKKIIQKLMKEKLKINCYFLIKGQGVKLILKADILLNCPVRYLLKYLLIVATKNRKNKNKKKSLKTHLKYERINLKC